MNKIIIFIIGIFGVLSLATPVFATSTETSYYTPDHFLKDGSASSLPMSWTSVTASDIRGYWDTSPFNIPAGAVIDYYKIKFDWNVSTSGWSFYAGASSNGGVTFRQPNSCNLSNETLAGYPCQINSPTGAQSNVIQGADNDNTAQTFTASDINSNQMYFKSYQSGGSAHNVSYSAFKVAVGWHIPVPALTISSLVTASGSATMTFNMTGDTKVTSANEQCRIDLWEQKVADGSFLTSVVAQIFLDSTQPRTSTLDNGNNTYQGYGYTSSVSTWSANGIHIPYFAGVNTQIVGQTQCSHPDASGSPVSDTRYQSINSLLPNWDPDLISTPSALQSTPTVPTPTCQAGDWACDWKQWFYTFFNNIFGFNSQLATQEMGTLLATAKTKMPFAYITAITSMDFTFPTLSTQSALPAINIPINPNVTLPNTTHISFVATVPESARGIFNTVRGFTTLLFWAVFIYYLIQTGRSLFK